MFEKDYQLAPLSEIENYIIEKGHLPGIPTEEEVRINGVNLGEISALLLQKVEELTLYLIEISKENKELKREFEILKDKTSH